MSDKQDIIQILKRNNNEKRQEKINNDNDIGTFAMLTYGRNAKMTFCVFMSEERHKPFLGMFIFIMGVSPLNFVGVSFLLTSLRKSYFLRQRIRRYRFLKAGTAALLVLKGSFHSQITFI